MLNITKNKSNYSKIRTIIILILLLVLGIFILFYSNKTFNDEAKLNKGYVYKYHYAFIADDEDDPFIKDIYNSAKEKGKTEGIYVDWSLDSRTTEYDKSDYLSIAIASKVDGIILVGENNNKILDLIEQAKENKIPVVTIMNDSNIQKGKNYICLDNNKLGNEYGLLIKEIIKSKAVNVDKRLDIVLLSRSNQDSNQKELIKSGIQDALSNDKEINIDCNIKDISLDNKVPFSAATKITSHIRESGNSPHVIICSTKEDTLNVYATLIDYSTTNNTKIFGFYDSTEILNAISHDNYIYATIKPDYKKIAYKCMDTLKNASGDLEKNNIIKIDSFDIIDHNNVDKKLKS